MLGTESLKASIQDAHLRGIKQVIRRATSRELSGGIWMSFQSGGNFPRVRLVSHENSALMF